jgi:hypothetical protein
MNKPGVALDVGFFYRGPYGQRVFTLERELKFGLLFFDKLALKAEPGQSYSDKYLLQPLQDRGLLEVLTPEEIMTPAALELQNDIILGLVQKGAFDYLGEDPRQDIFTKINVRPFQYAEYAIAEHRAFLTPVGEELVRRKLAMPYRAQVPEELRQEFERRGMQKDDLRHRYRPSTDSDLPNTMTDPYKAFPPDEPPWQYNLKPTQPIEFDGRTFIQLAVHQDVAFLHQQIVGMIAHSSSTAGKQYHPFTHVTDRRAANSFLVYLPGSAYAEIVATDLEPMPLTVS